MKKQTRYEWNGLELQINKITEADKIGGVYLICIGKKENPGSAPYFEIPLDKFNKQCGPIIKQKGSNYEPTVIEDLIDTYGEFMGKIMEVRGKTATSTEIKQQINQDIKQRINRIYLN